LPSCRRPNPDDHTQAGTLTFNDGSSIDVAGIADDGSMKTIVFDAKTRETQRR